MEKLTLEQAKKLILEFGEDLGDVCNDAYDAIEETPPGPTLQSILDSGLAKVRQYDSILPQLSDTIARQFRSEYERRIERLKANLIKLERKQNA